MDYYRTRFDCIAKGLEQDILKRENEKYSKGLYEFQKETDFSCYGVEKEDVNIVLCRKGKQIVFVRYYDGTVSLDELIKIVLEKLESNILSS